MLIVSFKIAMIICLISPSAGWTDSYIPEEGKYDQLCTGNHITFRSCENAINAKNILFNLHDLESPVICLKQIFLGDVPSVELQGVGLLSGGAHRPFCGQGTLGKPRRTNMSCSVGIAHRDKYHMPFISPIRSI